MCKVLQIARSTFYYETEIAAEKEEEKAAEEQKLKDKILLIFNENRQVYGTRKIKKGLTKAGFTVSRRRIGRLMNELGIESTYAQPTFKPMITQPNEDDVQNLLDRNFDVDESMSVLVSDLTYVRVGKQWNYVCFLLDLYNREIVGYSAGKRKDAALVRRAFASVKPSLGTVKIFHTDRGSEFKNVAIDELLSANNIDRSLSAKGNPYDYSEYLKMPKLESIYLKYKDYLLILRHNFYLRPHSLSIISSLFFHIPSSFFKRLSSSESGSSATLIISRFAYA